MNPDDRPTCNVCDSTRFSSTPTHHYTPMTVAGVAVDFGDTALEILTCEDCQHAFKWPHPPADEIDRCYRESAPTTWASPDSIERRFDQLVNDVLEHRSGGKILDIGCAGGEFLQAFPEGFEKFGLEPSSAATVARSAGVSMLGGLLDDLGTEYDQTFDVAVALDVLEHVVDGRAFVAEVARILKPGGIFLALTGNTDALSWRIEKGSYWYCAMPEHLAFHNTVSVRRLLATAGFQTLGTRTTPHKRYSPLTYVNQALRSWMYIVGRKLPLPKSFAAKLDRPAPYWEATRNHLVVVARSAASSSAVN